MSFSKTVAQIRNRTKTETRRLGWAELKPGELFCAIVKGQGLKKGERIERLEICVCVSNRPEPLGAITPTDVRREGFPGLPVWAFVDKFCTLNRCGREQVVNRIEFRYIAPERSTREILRLKLKPLPPARREWYRADGNCLCECGAVYRLHPLDPADLDYEGHPYMHVLCNGDRVKL
jgi:hypothetical protein